MTLSIYGRMCLSKVPIRDFKLKNPTRKTAVMIALYKKAISGDLSAIREIDSILSGNPTESYKGTVTIIDDIRLQALSNSG